MSELVHRTCEDLSSFLRLQARKHERRLDDGRLAGPAQDPGPYAYGIDQNHCHEHQKDSADHGIQPGVEDQGLVGEICAAVTVPERNACSS